MATPRRLSDDASEADPAVSTVEDTDQAPVDAVSPLPGVTIADVFACLGAYLTAHYADSVTDQAAVDDAARLLADGHVIPAWRAMATMVEQVLNVPPGG